MTARLQDIPAAAASFLVVADDGDCGWGVDVEHVASISHDDAGRAIDAAELGFPGNVERPRRVLRISGERSPGIVVRRKLAIITVPRDRVHPLPDLIETSMQRRRFSAVVFAEDHEPFVILDVDAAFEEVP